MSDALYRCGTCQHSYFRVDTSLAQHTGGPDGNAPVFVECANCQRREYGHSLTGTFQKMGEEKKS